MTDILMPALSPTMEEGAVAKWLVKPGDRIEPGQAIAEIETDKATMEVEAVDEGVLAEILVPAGTQGVKVNTPIARLQGEAPALSRPATATAPADEAPSKALPTQAPVPRPPAAGAPAIAERARIMASPLARRMAKQGGLDLAGMVGTGPRGRIIRRDVEKALQAGAGKSAPAPAALIASPAAAADVRPRRSLEDMGIVPGSYDLVPLDGMRRAIARRMTDSFRDVPHFPLEIDVEIDALLAGRSRVNALLEGRGVKVSVNDFIIKACALALKLVPEANASYTPDGLAMHHRADIAVAVAIEGGLITPIVRAAETKGLAQIALEMRDLAERAKARRLKPEEYQGGTFSVSNLGMFGIRSFGSILNEPQGCILSVGAGEARPVVRDGQIAIATVMSLTLTCDHRVVDGATGARFLRALSKILADPIAMLA